MDEISTETNAEVERDPRFRCCCKLCHSKTGAYVVCGTGTLGLALQAYNLITTIQTPRSRNHYATDSKPIFPAVGLGFSAVLVSSLFFGLLLNRPCLLLPHLICQALLTLLFGFLFLAVIIGIIVLEAAEATTVFGPEADADFVQLFSVGMIAGVLGLLQLWCFVVVFTCYRYLREKRRCSSDSNNCPVTAQIRIESNDDEISASDTSVQSSTPLVK